MQRGRIIYSFGSKTAPGDPFGVSILTVEVDGAARLVQDKREGLFVFTGAVEIEDFWTGLENAGFPKFEMLPPKSGSGVKTLRVGSERVFFPYHSVPAPYAGPFGILDSVITKLAESGTPSTVTRGRISYSVGNKHNPGDPWGRCSLSIELDGRARLEQDTMGGVFVFTGRVASAALEQFWRAIEISGFPVVPGHPTPAGSASRDLEIGAVSNEFPIAYHSVGQWRGYGPAFSILDNVIRQISLDTIKEGPVGAPIVEGATKVA